VCSAGKSRRNAALPDLPTVAERLPGFEAYGWNGVFVRVDTPAQIIAVRTFRSELVAAVETSPAPECSVSKIQNHMLAPHPTLSP
jgi:tripartite-type tricarboxylate transporter receptor subunit TctC